MDVSIGRCDCLAPALLLNNTALPHQRVIAFSFICSAFHSRQLLLCHTARLVSDVLIYNVLHSKLKLAQQAATACPARSAPEQLLPVLGLCFTCLCIKLPS